jgi:hypothetical protein
MAIYLCPGQEKPSALKREHLAFQKMKFINFFLYLWVIFALLDPDPNPAEQNQYGVIADPRIHNTA